jgi:hypothetical protein
MIDWKTIRNLILGKPSHPPIIGLRETRDDSLYFDSLTRGCLVEGGPGSGKTSWGAMQIADYGLMYPDRPIFVLDASGSLTNEVIEIIHFLPAEKRDALLRRLVLDIPGDEQWVIPKPFFDDAYGLSDEEQVQIATNIVEELNSEKVELTPMMAMSLTTTAPNLFRLLKVIRNELGECWQITEGKKLLAETWEGGLLERACKRYGGFAPEAKWYFENQLLRDKITAQAIESRTAALIGTLGVVESRSLRARYGFYRPGITPREVIDKGLIYLVSGEKLANQESAQAWVFWHEFASLRAVINQRTPHDPHSKPVLLVIDEVYRLFEIKGMAKALGQVSTYFRSRKLMPIIIIQAHWQLSELLKEQIWNLGNIVSFSMENFKNAYDLAQQIFKYDPKSVKLAAVSPTGQPVVEPDRGQYLGEANWIQNLKKRQVIMRRYKSEGEKESFINFVAQTKDKPQGVLPAPLSDLKLELLKRRAIPVRDALEVINQRKITYRTERPTV